MVGVVSGERVVVEVHPAPPSPHRGPRPVVEGVLQTMAEPLPTSHLAGSQAVVEGFLQRVAGPLLPPRWAGTGLDGRISVGGIIRKLRWVWRGVESEGLGPPAVGGLVGGRSCSWCWQWVCLQT